MTFTEKIGATCEENGWVDFLEPLFSEKFTISEIVIVFLLRPYNKLPTYYKNLCISLLSLPISNISSVFAKFDSVILPAQRVCGLSALYNKVWEWL